MKNCDECERTFQCLTSKRCWLHEEPVILINNQMIPKGIEITCPENLGVVLLNNEKITELMQEVTAKIEADGGSVDDIPMEAVLGEQFAIYLYNCADEKWLEAMLARFGKSMPPKGEEEAEV